MFVALEKAKEAGRRERQLCKLREQQQLGDQINLDLTFAVVFSLAHAYVLNGMYAEALNAYTSIVKNKSFPQSGRLRVNMGNIYFHQSKYPMAIKMYRMALDQVTLTKLPVMRHFNALVLALQKIVWRKAISALVYMEAWLAVVQKELITSKARRTQINNVKAPE